METRFRERVAAERKERGWSQADLAKMLRNKGIHSIYPTTVAKIESGERAVRIDEASALADLFEVSIDALMGRKAGLGNDVAFAVRALRRAAEKSMDDVGAIKRTMVELATEVLAFDFEGREALDADVLAVLNALTSAEEPLYKIGGYRGFGGFELPTGKGG